MWGILLTGIMTWVIGRPANHIGASGVIYLLASFLFFKGVLSRYYRLIALSLIVVFLYGGMLWFVVPVDPGISWEGHLSGLVVGLVFAFIYKKKIVKRPKFEWERPDYKEEEDEFMQQFDENGNFIGAPLPPKGEKMDPEKIPKDISRITYRYIFKKSNNQEE